MPSNLDRKPGRRLQGRAEFSASQVRRRGALPRRLPAATVLLPEVKDGAWALDEHDDVWASAHGHPPRLDRAG